MVRHLIIASLLVFDSHQQALGHDQAQCLASVEAVGKNFDAINRKNNNLTVMAGAIPLYFKTPAINNTIDVPKIRDSITRANDRLAAQKRLLKTEKAKLEASLRAAASDHPINKKIKLTEELKRRRAGKEATLGAIDRKLFSISKNIRANQLLLEGFIEIAKDPLVKSQGLLAWFKRGLEGERVGGNQSSNTTLLQQIQTQREFYERKIADLKAKADRVIGPERLRLLEEVRLREGRLAFLKQAASEAASDVYVRGATFGSGASVKGVFEHSINSRRKNLVRFIISEHFPHMNGKLVEATNMMGITKMFKTVGALGLAAGFFGLSGSDAEGSTLDGMGVDKETQVFSEDPVKLAKFLGDGTLKKEQVCDWAKKDVHFREVLSQLVDQVSIYGVNEDVLVEPLSEIAVAAHDVELDSSEPAKDQPPVDSEKSR